MRLLIPGSALSALGRSIAKRTAPATLLVATVALAGCVVQPAQITVDTSDSITPGIVESSDHLEATGVLMRLDDGEGLFYAIVGEQDPVLSQMPPLIAILANPETVDAPSHVGQTVRISGVQDPNRAENRDVPRIRARSLTVLDSTGGLGRLQVPEPSIREVGIHALQDGRTQIVGEIGFFDAADRPGERFWVLNAPEAHPEQMGVWHLAIIENAVELGLPERAGEIVALNGSLVESATAPLGLPVLRAEEIVSPH